MLNAQILASALEKRIKKINQEFAQSKFRNKDTTTEWAKAIAEEVVKHIQQYLEMPGTATITGTGTGDGKGANSGGPVVSVVNTTVTGTAKTPPGGFK